MRVTFLGTGTSGGVPIINCSCSVCTSNNPKNKRLRCSIMVEMNGRNLLIDTSTDMREQFLRNPFPKIDAILYTHAHADHVFGLDEVRRYNYLLKKRIPAFGNSRTMERLQRVFDYAFQEKGSEIVPGIPNLYAEIIDDVFEIDGIRITPVPLIHGKDFILGFRIGKFAYCTDVSLIPESSYPLLKDLDVLVLDALREKKHPSHFSLDEAVYEAQKIGAAQTYLTHMSHILDYDRHGELLPEHVSFAYDGLVIEVSES